MTPRISNLEFGFIIGILGLIDLAQIAIEWVGVALTAVFGIGLPIVLFVNRFIDVGVGLLLPLYLRLRRQKITSPSQIGGLIGVFTLEFIPVLDQLPLWCLDGIFYMYTIKLGYKKEDAQLAQDEEAQQLKDQEAIASYQVASQEELQEDLEISRQETPMVEESTPLKQNEDENQVEDEGNEEIIQDTNTVDINQYRRIKNIRDENGSPNEEYVGEDKIAA